MIEKKINQFYRDVIRSRGNLRVDSITEFIKMYSKIQFYSKGNFALEELLEEAVTYVYETFGCRKDEYDFWYQAINDVVFRLKMMISDQYDYEYEQAKKFLEQQKQKRKEFE